MLDDFNCRIHVYLIDFSAFNKIHKLISFILCVQILCNNALLSLQFATSLLLPSSFLHITYVIYYYYYYHHHHHLYAGIYTYTPETNYVPRDYSVAAILLLLFTVLISLVSVLNLLYFYISTYYYYYYYYHHHLLLYAGYLYLYS